VTARPLGVDDTARVDRLIESYPFNSYRNYRMLPRRRQAAVLKAEIDRALASPSDRFATIAGDGARTSVAICRRLPWDTAWFGLGMARVDYLLRGADADRATMADALEAALEQCRGAGIRQVTAKLDVADTDGIAVVEDHGFRLMDNMATYLYHPKRPTPPPVKAIGAIRAFAPGDVDQIIDITLEAYAPFRGRFHLDPRFSTARAVEMYAEWARKCCTGERAGRIFVAEDSDGHLFGFLAMQVVEPVSSIGGVTLFAGVLGACRREQPGAYAGLIHAATAENYAAGSATEGQTQNFNFSTVRIYEVIGAQYVRADYTFHAWLG
jgi:hypothetical protein